MQITNETRIGFIGTGVMGLSMAGHLLKAGFPLAIHNRTRSRGEPLLRAGASWAESPARVAAQSSVVLTMVGFPSDVEQVYLGKDGLLAASGRGSMTIDLTTSSPQLAKRIHEEASRAGVQALDAPVSGGDIGAREARLAIMVGGDRDVFESARSLLGLMGSPSYMGPAGSGQHAKMVNQIAIASNMVGIGEAMAYAVRSGLDPRAVLACIEHGAAGSWALSHLAPKMLAGDYAPGFYVKHFVKDMKIAIESAEELGLDLPGLRLARALYGRLADSGGAELGTQGLFRLFSQG